MPASRLKNITRFGAAGCTGNNDVKSWALALFSLIAFPAAASAPSVSALEWMSGCWSSTDGEPGSGEYWLSPAGGTMLGINRTVRDQRTVSFEFLRISEADDGSIVLVAAPSGQQVTTFALISLSEEEAVFENPGHDFPQRVAYRLLPGGRLVGRIEGTIDGETRRVDFPMKKADCSEHLG